MTRLTIAGVIAYAAECGYSLIKVSKGYCIQTTAKYLDITQDVGECGYIERFTTIASAKDWVDKNPLPAPAIAQQELEASIDDQSEIIQIEDTLDPTDFVFGLTECEYLSEVDGVLAQAQVKCVYPNCEQPCTRDCEVNIRCECCGEVFDPVDYLAHTDFTPLWLQELDGGVSFVEAIVHECTPQENTSIYIDEIVASPLGGYEVITTPPQMQRYEIPLLEKCLQIEPEPTLADVIREFNDLPLFVQHLPRKADFEEVRATIVVLSRYADCHMTGGRELMDTLKRLLSLRNECNSNASVTEKIKAMHEIVCIYRDFRKPKSRV